MLDCPEEHWSCIFKLNGQKHVRVERMGGDLLKWMLSYINFSLYEVNPCLNNNNE